LFPLRLFRQPVIVFCDLKHLLAVYFGGKAVRHRAGFFGHVMPMLRGTTIRAVMHRFSNSLYQYPARHSSSMETYYGYCVFCEVADTSGATSEK
jgi:hypothetical protein